MDAPGPPPPSSIEISLLAVGAQVTFATLVNVLAGAPPALEGTLLFGVGLAGALLIQCRRHQRWGRSAPGSSGDAETWRSP